MSARRFLEDTAGMAAGQFVARGILLARGLVSAAALGPAGYGAWNALNLILDYGSYTSAGALQGLDQRLPAAAGRDDRAAEARLLGGAWGVTLGGAAAFALAVAVLFAWRPPAPLRGLAGAAALMVAAVVLQLAIQVHGSALRARGRFGPVSAATAAQALIGGGLGLALVWSFGIPGLVAGWLVGGAVALLWLRRDAGHVPLAPRGLGDGLALARIGLPIFAFFLVSLLLRSVDRLALIRFGAAADLGLYALGLMAAGLVLYVPEAAAAVLYPRIVAAAQGARDPDTTRAEVNRAHRALAVTLPLAVAVGVVWARPVVALALPAYASAVPPLRLLAIGALLLSAATIPAYVLLGRGQGGRLLVTGALAALATGALVFGVASFDSRPTAVALAATAGYALFALGLVALAAVELFDAPSERIAFAVASLVPAAWAGALALAACAVGPGGLAAASARSAAVALGYLPALWWFGRGLGLRRLARDWIHPRPALA